MVQRMTSSPSGRLKKFEPLDTRDFVPFNFEELTLDNIKMACQTYYKAPMGSCDVLASDRGPSCTRIEQLKGKKIYYIRFLEFGQPSPAHSYHYGNAAHSSKVNLPQNESLQSAVVYPKSVPISVLLKAGQLNKTKQNLVSLKMEKFDVHKMKWFEDCSLMFDIAPDKFASGAFRDAFMAITEDSVGKKRKWVIKKYKETTLNIINDDLNMELGDHARKQVQMQAVAKNIAQSMAKKAPVSFGKKFLTMKHLFHT